MIIHMVILILMTISRYIRTIWLWWPKWVTFWTFSFYPMFGQRLSHTIHPCSIAPEIFLKIQQKSVLKWKLWIPWKNQELVKFTIMEIIKAKEFLLSLPFSLCGTIFWLSIKNRWKQKFIIINYEACLNRSHVCQSGK